MTSGEIYSRLNKSIGELRAIWTNLQTMPNAEIEKRITEADLDRLAEAIEAINGKLIGRGEGR